MKVIRLLILGCFLFTQGLAQTESSQETRGDDSQTLLAIAGSFWTALSLGDLEDLKPLVREADVPYVPVPKGEGAEMMKMKSLEQLKPLRDEIKKAIIDAFVIEEPQLAEDKMVATMKIKPNVDKLLSFYELKMVYDIYMAEAYHDQKANREFQTLESVKTKVLVQGSPHRKRIEQKVAGIQGAQLPTLHFERTESGWRANFSKLLGK